MCGILAVIGEKAQTVTWDKALATLEHRGPDDAQVFRNEWLGLAHRRLAIIDLATGQQPLKSDHSVLICNGEIYGYEAQREALIREGFKFRSASDSEVILHLYQKYGLAFLDHLRGEFAFVLYDQKSERIIAARDRFGIKPLYYARVGQSMVLASEAKGIFATGLIEAKIDHRAVRDLLSFVPPDTIFSGIETLAPGSFMIIERDGRTKFETYWKLGFEQSREGAFKTFDESAKALREAVDESIRLRLRADVPVGVYLSGGIDSSAVAATAQEFSAHPLKAFHVSFQESATFDERPLAEATAKAKGLDLHIVSADRHTMLKALTKTLWHSEHPIANLHGAAKYLVAEEAAKHVKVILTGEGADELFLGYDYFRAANLSHQFGRKKRKRSDLGDQMLTSAIGFVPIPELSTALERQDRLSRVFAADIRSTLKETSPLDRIKMRLEAEDLNSLEETRKRQAYSFRAMLAPYHLAGLGDRQDMAWSLEGRPPLLDHVLFDLVKRIPIAHKTKDGRDKAVWRQAMADRLIEPVAAGKKWPFAAPLLTIKEGVSPVLDELIARYLSPRAIEESAIFDPRAIARIRLISRFVWGDALKRLSALLFCVINVQILHDLYVNKSAAHK